MCVIIDLFSLDINQTKNPLLKWIFSYILFYSKTMQIYLKIKFQELL